MADKKDSVLDKAENLARRMLERIGSKVDGKLGSSTDAALSHREVSDLTARLEKEIEANLRNDSNGVKRIAPNRIRIGFTYERATLMSDEYLDALAKEFKGAAYEFIVNRRYSTLAPLTVEAVGDLFTKSTVIKTQFDGESEATAAREKDQPTATPTKSVTGEKTLRLRCSDGRNFRVTLKAGSAPATIGRTAGNAIQLDDSSVSRMHCSLALKSNGEVVTADLGSANGTTINGKLLAASEARTLNKGDQLGVGDLRLTVDEIEY